jgi:hypothetical protein
MEHLNTKKDPIVTLWIKNYAENQLNKWFSKPNTKPIKFLSNNDTFNQCPVVLIAAGPSLDKNIHLLTGCQKNCVIVCADVVLYKLLEYKIKPDFVVSIDPHPSIPRFWKGLDTTGLNFVCPTTVSPASLDAWKGNIFFFNQSDLPESEKQMVLTLLTQTTSGFGSLENRFFVGATMFQLAKLFNPSMISLLGFDFGFSDGKAYCDGFLDRKLYDDNNVGMDVLRAREVIGEISIQVDDKKIRTTRLLDFYKQTLLQLMEKERIPIINATEGGILTELLRMPLAHVIQEYFTKPLQKENIHELKRKKRKKKR